MKGGDIVVTHLPQSDGNAKLKPVLLLKQMPGFNDFLVCGISTQLHQMVTGFDELLDEQKLGFAETGLHKSSIIRLSFLAVVPTAKIAGAIGNIDPVMHRSLLERLAAHLLN